MNRPLIPDTLADAIKPLSLANKIRGQHGLHALMQHAIRADSAAGPITEEDVIRLMTNLHHAIGQAGYCWDYIRITARDHYIAQLDEGIETQRSNGLVREYAEYVASIPIDSLNPKEPLNYDQWLQQEHGE